ncbi:sugar-transfer associated ATP-grasp domain-containing protein [Aerococcus urinaeequi]|uniref:sugar-transfer associated ATP-grasp domain-containing protein n=1 Tax=Aerococcus urinaeequi TaxID=51665 RepID=UPI003ED8D7FD
MDKNNIKSIINDRYDFFEDYIKDILPRRVYKKAFISKIKNSAYINDFDLTEEFKRKTKNYWKEYENISLLWHQVYIATNEIEDYRYIPEDVFYKRIEPTLNNFALYRAYSDKNVYDKLFQEYKMPKTLLRNMHGCFYDEDYKVLTSSDVFELFMNYAKNYKMVLKPSIDSGGGRDIEVIDLRSKSSTVIKNFLMDTIKKFNSNFILQEYLEQHHLMAEMHKDSLNTVRIITLRLNNQIYILSSIVRMGNNGSKVDNATVGGLTCGFNYEGKFNEFATDHLEYRRYSAHPYSNFLFKNKVIPNYDKCFELVNNAHNLLPHFDLVSWDIAIDNIGEPNLIEINLKAQDINFHQRNNGPLFGEITNEVLTKVYQDNI